MFPPWMLLLPASSAIFPVVLAGRPSSRLVHVHPAVVRSSGFVFSPSSPSFRRRRRPKVPSFVLAHHEDAHQDESSTTIMDAVPRRVPFSVALAMYALVPFLPAAILGWETDRYRFLRRQFLETTAAAATATDLSSSLSSSSLSDVTRALFVLLATKRLALYFVATMATLYAGWRASRVMIRDSPREDGPSSNAGGPGKALDALNSEILRGRLSFDNDGRMSEEEDDDDNHEGNPKTLSFATMLDEAEERDEEHGSSSSSSSSNNAGKALALLLPIGLASSLAVSYVILSVLAGTNGLGLEWESELESEWKDGGASAWNAVIRPFFLGMLPLLPLWTSLPSLLLSLLFTATEFRWALFRETTNKNRDVLDRDDDCDNPEKLLPSTNRLDSTSGKALNLAFPTIQYSPPPFSVGNILAVMYVAGAYFAKDHPTVSLPQLLLPGSTSSLALQSPPPISSLSSSLSSSSSLDLWPFQNGVNIALATTVTRALAPFLVGFPFSYSHNKNENKKKKFRLSIQTIAVASLGVTVFDVVSVFGTVVNAASMEDAIGSSPSSSMSVMEAVARSKLYSSSSPSSPSSSWSSLFGVSPWQPGLLEIAIGGRITDALGLGDVVFPACVVAWAFVADAVVVRNREIDELQNHSGEEGNNGSSNDDGGSGNDDGAVIGVNGVPNNKGSLDFHYSYTAAATGGYVIGSFLTEIVGSSSLLGPKSSGLPALVFLMPCMLMAVVFVAAARGEVEDMLLGGDGGNDDDDDDDGDDDDDENRGR